ncbi:hypothetical protein LWI29_023633 [Acer saccharum]|uniref:Putative plant transposon protein domain-containing protein n=1 Tax=Acer saccharum TaxID=4024 RepID=A0AA39RJ56_ACESA|nr:hypothetical protein LWI29_023633 [Acer saccharum]
MASRKKTKRFMSRGESLGTSDPSVLPPPSGKGKGDIVSPPPDPDNPKKWALFGNRRVWPERGIDMTVSGSTFLPQAVKTLGWAGFVRTPNMAALDLNEYRSPLLLSELKLDAAFWNLFFDYSLALKTHRTDLGYDTARFLFCARNRLQMDIGQIIVQHIHKGAKSKGPLLFPCLITHFCEEAGIEWDRAGDNMITPTSDIKKKTYNELARRRGVRPIGANVLDDDDLGLNEDDLLGLNELDDPDDADFDAQNPRGGPDAGIGTQEPSMA